MLKSTQAFILKTDQIPIPGTRFKLGRPIERSEGPLNYGTQCSELNSVDPKTPKSFKPCISKEINNYRMTIKLTNLENSMTSGPRTS